MTDKLTRKEIAKRFDVSVSSVRVWQREFSDWLSVSKQRSGGGRRTATKYDENDLLVFATIRRLTGQNLTYDAIRQVLDKEIPLTSLPSKPENAGDEGDEKPGTDMVPFSQYAAVVASMKESEGRLTATLEERDYLRERVEKLEDKLDDTRDQLDEERQKSWWAKLRGR